MLRDQIESDFKTAFKAKNEIAKSSLGNLKAALKTVEIEKGHPLTDEEVTAVITKKVKQHKDSIDSFEKGARADLAEHEKAQMTILSAYLPAALSEDEIGKMVTAVISETQATAKDFGKVMKEVVARSKGAADGSVISKLVKEQLK